MPSCVIVADDLTGANTTGVLLRKAGLKALAVLDPSGQSGADVGAFDAVVVPTNSRALDGGDAYRRVFAAVATHAGPDTRLYSKRIDSTLRGNIGSETDAILDALGDDSVAIVVPAFPASNRIMVGGYLLVNAVPLHRTEAASDPKNPVDTAKCVDILLRQGKYQAASLHIADLMEATPRLAEKIRTLAASGVRYLVCDAACDDDLLRLAEAVAASGIRFAAVDPGAFTGVMAHVLFSRKSGKSGRVLAAVGSVNGVAMRQAKHYLGGVPSFNVFMRAEEFLAGDERREAEIARLADAVLSSGASHEVCGILGDCVHSDKRLPLEAVSRERGCGVDELSEVINNAVAEAVARIITADESFGGLYTSGGDITIAVCRRLEASGLRLLDEVLPLAAYAEMIGGARAGTRIVSKGGMVGPDDAMAICVRYLLGKLNDKGDLR